METSYNPLDEFRQSVATLRKLLDKCVEQGDNPTALQVIKEINRLFKLYTEEFHRQDTTSPEAQELLEIREYLLTLDLTKKDVPTLELARLATYKLREFLDVEEKRNSSVPKQTTRRGPSKPRKVAGRTGHLPGPPGTELASPQ